jgi:hypothetical protein
VDAFRLEGAQMVQTWSHRHFRFSYGYGHA